MNPTNPGSAPRRASRLVTAMILMVAVIHLLPLSGALGADRLAELYGIPFIEPNIVILMRHRAVLFGLFGVFLGYAAFRPALQAAAFASGFVSVLSFLALAGSMGGYNEAVGRILAADLVALVCLLIGTAAFARARG